MKTQLEIQGAERPSIPVIDEAICELIEIQNEINSLELDMEELRARVDSRILEHKDQLEMTTDGRPVYVFKDGGFQRPFVVHQKTWIKVGKKTRIKDEDEAA